MQSFLELGVDRSCFENNKKGGRKLLSGGVLMLKCWKAAAVGLATGVLNGFFGAGGGMVAVPFFKKCGLSVKEAHASSLAVTFALSCLSTALYLLDGRFALHEAAAFIPAGIAGAIVGALVFRRLPSVWIRRVFGAFVVFAALRMLI